MLRNFCDFGKIVRVSRLMNQQIVALVTLSLPNKQRQLRHNLQIRSSASDSSLMMLNEKPRSVRGFSFIC